MVRVRSSGSTCEKVQSPTEKKPFESGPIATTPVRMSVNEPRYMLTASTPLGLMRKFISSENISSPAGIVTLSSPPNVTRRALCRLISLSPMARASVTRVSVTGSVPQKFEKCRRTFCPPNAQVTGYLNVISFA